MVHLLKNRIKLVLPALLFSWSFLMLTAQSDTINHWETVVFASDTFRYFPGTSQPPADWMQPSFDDAAWQQGPGGFGYGDGDDVTLLPQGILSVFLRKPFELTDTALILWGVLHMDYDDGFVAYLNGHEIARGNLGEPGTAVSYNQQPETWHEAVMYQGGYPETFVIRPESLQQFLVEGENLLAIQVNNYGITSSDFSAIPFLSFAFSDSVLHYREPPAWFIPPATEFTSSLPIILIDTYGQEIPDEPKIDAWMRVLDNPAGVNKLADTIYTYDGYIGVELRGSSTQMFPKKAYSLETRDSSGANNNVPLLGLPQENDWVLYAPYSDKSMMRNVVAYKMWRDLGHYAPGTKYCEVFVNGDYRGVYVLTEKIKRDAARVNIARMDSLDITGDAVTGGYILKIDKTDEPGIEGWTSYPSPGYPGGPLNFIQYVYPKYKYLKPEQITYIQYFMQQMESSLTRSDFSDPVTGYKAYIEPVSFADYILVNELGKNVDGYRFSTYFYKDRDSNGGLLKMGPLWDFNLCFGNVDYGAQECWDPTKGWVYEGYRIFWFKRLMEDPAFAALVHSRWSLARSGRLSDNSVHGLIDSLRTVLATPQIRNFQRWPVLGTYIWPNREVYNTWEEEVNALSAWIDSRLNFMDSQYLTDIPTVKDDAFYINVFPNPFKERTGFYINSGQPEQIRLDIYNLNGQRILSIKQHLPTGGSVILWDGRNSAGSRLDPGVYIYRLSRKGRVPIQGKIVIQKN